jgi:hypothetical protein
MNDETKDLILSVFEASLDAQLRAVRRLRQGAPAPTETRPRKGLSQVDMAFDILKKARAPLHISQILERIQAQFGVAVDRESLVSSLTKRVARQDLCYLEYGERPMPPSELLGGSQAIFFLKPVSSTAGRDGLKTARTALVQEENRDGGGWEPTPDVRQTLACFGWVL